MPHTAYITVVPVLSDEPSAPSAWYRVHVNDVEIVAGRTPTGRPRWFTKIDAAIAVAYEQMLVHGVKDLTRVEWVPQYDSSFAEALNEPVGYLAAISS